MKKSNRYLFFISLLFLNGLLMERTLAGRSNCQKTVTGEHMHWIDKNPAVPKSTKAYLHGLYYHCFSKDGTPHEKCKASEARRVDEILNWTMPTGVVQGSPEGIRPNPQRSKRLNPVLKESIEGEVHAAEAVAYHGYKVRYASDVNDGELIEVKRSLRQKEGLPHNSDFDLIIEEHPFDVYSPLYTSGIETVKSGILHKVERGQTKRVVVWAGDIDGVESKIADPSVISDLRKELHLSNSENLREVILVRGTPDSPELVRVFP